MKLKYDAFHDYSYFLLTMFMQVLIHVLCSSRTFFRKYFKFKYTLTSKRGNLFTWTFVTWYFCVPREGGIQHDHCFLKKLRAICFFFNAGDKWYKVKYLEKHGRKTIFFRTLIIISRIKSQNSTFLFCYHLCRQKSLQIYTQWNEKRFSENLRYELFSTTDSGELVH